jgi:hypothetical protein
MRGVRRITSLPKSRLRRRQGLNRRSLELSVLKRRTMEWSWSNIQANETSAETVAVLKQQWNNDA